MPTRRTRETTSFDALMDLCAQYMPAGELELVHRAYRVAEKAHGGVTRKSGEPFIEHPLAVARILAELAVDAQGIAAALLHDTVEDTSITREDVEREFGPVVADIVDGVTKFTEDEAEPQGNGTPPEPKGQIASIEERAQRKRLERSATMRKLLLAMRDDPRVVLLKIADRLHNLRTLGSMNQVQKERTARETMETYAPLASRIGLYAIKNELEDLAFYHLERDSFDHVTARLGSEVGRRRAWADRLCATLRRTLAEHGIAASVNWRVKHPYRTYYEAGESGADIPQLLDLIAFRVLVTRLDDCYRALAVVHNLWRPYRYRDYIASPKINGYQSFHTTVFALDGRLAPLHIRTHTMHRAAQYGIATYWLERAAQGMHVDGSNPAHLRDMLGWMADITNLDEELGANPVELMAAVQGEMLHNQIFVNTPKGDTISLPEGSTVLDMAYRVHTEIGDHTVGAYIQYTDGDGVLRGREARPDHVVQPGDVVYIRTSRDMRPTLDWLDMIRTRYAREKITRALRLQQRALEQDVAGPAGADTTTTTRATRGITPQPLRHPSGGVARVSLAQCCYPCPGDPIAGLVLAGRRIAIHRTCCRRLAAVVARRKREGKPYAEPLRVTWVEFKIESYVVPFILTGQDHPGLMHEVSDCATMQELNVIYSFANANTSRYKARISITLRIPAKVRLEQVIGRLRRIQGLVDIIRDETRGCGKDQQQGRQ